MEYDSEYSVENGHSKSEEASEEPEKQSQQQQKSCQTDQLSPISTWRLINAATATAINTTASSQAKLPLGAAANKSLSSQVMEYYQKYSQNSNLNQYFLPTCADKNGAEGANYYYSIYELSPKCVPGRKNCVEQDHSLNPCLPKERRRWIRPPLIGQSSSAETPSAYIKPSMTEPKSLSPRASNQQEEAQRRPPQKQQQHHFSNTSVEAFIITEEKSTETSPEQETSPLPATEASIERKASSPTSSVASHKPLEWDSGADVGYLYASGQRLSSGGSGDKQLSTIERMALARGCSAALRLDPEGTTGQQQSPGSIRTTVTAVLSLTTRSTSTERGFVKNLSKPDANSTPLVGNVSGSESEIEITPIVKNHLSGIVAGNDIKSDDVGSSRSRKELLKTYSLDDEIIKSTVETPRSTNPFKLPLALSYPPDASTSRSKTSTRTTETTTAENADDEESQSPLKKSSSMNLLASPGARLPLKRSQSDLNLCGNDKAVSKLIFNSTSSIATVVNKPATCNKLIQTSMRPCSQESIGVQVSVCKEEERPPLPKRATSLVARSLNSILKNPKSTYRVQNPQVPSSKDSSKSMDDNDKDDESSSDSSRNGSLTPQADDAENVIGRANSFEYFPGHIYENVPNGSTSQVSSVDTGRSNSTMPNTSSSIDEKLWGDSNNLVRDLERSVNILKSLVDANKLDKQVKKRLIHHVVKRLVSAKYTDDKIEHNLEENVPWNPADVRNKVYRTEIIQALAKNTTDSSDDWKPAQKKKSPKKSAAVNEARAIKEIIDMPAEIESSNSDKFDRNTDRTVMDGRKARMGLRTDDCDRQSSTNTPTNKSESSDCFLPQRGFGKNGKVKDIFTTSTSNSSPQDQNRALLDAVVNSRRSPVDSSREGGNSADWRLPATMSERRYDLRRCSASDSGDAKLVSYAEMEKRNQLIWITNEISHLSNLKKLLEQPKTKIDRSAKASPRKTKQSSAKQAKPQSSSPSHRHQNGHVFDVESRLTRQWSSHCNLAHCSPGVNAVTRLKKRNSCTQTATENFGAYSRMGSEIISARIQSPNIKFVHACVQTPRPPAPVPVSTTQQMYQSCPVHRAIPPPNCTCSELICLVCDSKNLSQRHQAFSEEERGNPQNGAKFLCNDSEDSKRTKNQLNANRLKCTCEFNDKQKKVDGPKKSETASQTYDKHRCEDSMCSSGQYKIFGSLCQCSKECNCENKKLVYEFEQLRVEDKMPPKRTILEKTGRTNYACQCKKSEVQSSRTDCSYHPTKTSQPYYLANSNKETNNQDCQCFKKPNDHTRNDISPKQSARLNDVIPKDRKCCRLCGTIYKVDRNCSCVIKNYPKPVAYELSFINDNKDAGSAESESCSKLEVEIKKIDKNTPPLKVKKSKKNGCMCRGSERAMKYCECSNREGQSRRFNNEKKATLQDYLVSNNPNFADNVETRRQYVSEIQRLRQLRKDKRVQLLAMASTSSNIFSAPKPTRVTKCVQRKISDEEMKARLKKRYFQLSEMRAKRRQQQLQEEARCNKLMAKIFCKKLQQKVLRGQVDLSQSVSVISNL